MQDIEIYIDEIVLDGFAGNDYAGIKAAIEEGLARLIRERGIPSLVSSPNHLRRMEGGAFNLARGTNAASVGNDIAGTVYNGLQNQKAPSKK